MKNKRRKQENIYLKNGDLVICKGNYGKEDKLINIFTLSAITHVGIIIIINNVPHIGEFTVQYENDEYVDHITKINKKKGGMIILLKKRLKTYNGSIFIKPINKEIEGEKIIEFFEKYKNNKFETKILEMLNAALKLNFVEENRKRKSEEFFCSEAIAQLLIELGLLNSNYNSNMYTPKDIGNLSELNNGFYYYDILIPLTENFEIKNIREFILKLRKRNKRLSKEKKYTKIFCINKIEQIFFNNFLNLKNY